MCGNMLQACDFLTLSRHTVGVVVPCRATCSDTCRPVKAYGMLLLSRSKCFYLSAGHEFYQSCIKIETVAWSLLLPINRYVDIAYIIYK